MENKSAKISFYVSALLFLALAFNLAMPTQMVLAAIPASIVYDATPNPLPPNLASLGFQATQTSEFGDYVHLAGTNRELRTVTVTMSDWALNSDYPAMPSAGWTHPITLNIYNVVPGAPLNTKGTLIGTVTQTFTIPWRPVADPSCPGGTAWRAADTLCYNGFAFNITFDMSSLNITLPNDLIVGIAYNTQTYGSTPLGVAGPYNSLNVGAVGSALVGTDDDTDRVFWNTATASSYTDGGAGGVGIFREDTGWTGNGTIPIQITIAPSIVYVDDSWVGTPVGTDPDAGAGPALSFGEDAFATIQEGVDAVATGGTVQVYAGTYREEPVIGKALSLLGPNDAINPNTGSRGLEAVIQPVTQGTDPNGTCTDILYVSVSDVTIKGFTVDGNNPTLTSGVLVNGVDVDACEGIAGFEGVGNIAIENNIVKNTTYTGVDFDNYNNTNATAGNYIRYNLLTNIGNSTIGYGIGVLVYDNFYADITDNVFTDVRLGIQTGNFFEANPGSTGSISNNDIHAWRAGIFHNLWYTNASNIPVSSNTISVIDSTGAPRWTGILFTSFAVPATITNNIITATNVTQETVGYMVWNDLATPTLTVSGGSVTGADYGVWVNNYQGYGPSNGGNTAITIDNVTISGASSAGVYVQDDPLNTNSATVQATIKNSPISASTVAVLVEGSDASATGSCNQISGNTAGVNNTTATVLDFEKNWWGAASGPSGSGSGSGDTVSANVDYTPWNQDTSCTVFTSNVAPVILQGISVPVTMSEDGNPTAFALSLDSSDANGDTLTWSILSPAGSGAAGVSATPPGNLANVSYTPLPNYNGLDSFDVQVSDGNGGFDTITVNVTIQPVADTPVIAESKPANVSMSEDGNPTPFSLSLNATDADLDTLTWSILSPAGSGAAGVSATPPGNLANVSYTPLPNYNGMDSFVVQVSDGNGGFDTITVNVTIQPAGDSQNLIWNQSYAIQYDTWLGVLDTNAALTFASGYRKAKSGTFTIHPVVAFTKIAWISYRGPDQGKARVYVDGVLKKTVDLYSPTPQWQYFVEITGLTNGKHTVVVKPLNARNVASSDNWVAVDGFKIGTKFYDDDYIGMSGLYSYGSWLGLRNPGARFKAYRLSSLKNATMKFSFDGAEFTWVTARGPAYGKAEIWVDGVLVKTVDLYRNKQQWQYRITVGALEGLVYGHHDVVIKVLGKKRSASSGTGIVSDGFEID